MRFSYPAVIAEANSFARDLEPFIDGGSLWQVQRFSSGLQTAQERAAPGSMARWTLGDVSSGALVKTIRTTDDIENAGLRVAFAFWVEIEQGLRGRRGIESFTVRAASVYFQLEAEDETCLHKFSIDIQSVSGPGAHLHVQSKGNYQNVGAFLELPRISVLSVLPMDALSVIMHEVYPQSWRRQIAGSTDARFHGPKQNARLTSVLNQWLAGIAGSVDPVGEIQQLRLAMI
jgi:hypothetical protein